MSFDWQNYLRLAQYMMDRAVEFPETEACYRSVVSRAYYSVFCLARNCVSEFDGENFYGNDHQALQDHFMSHTHRARTRLGNKLGQLHQDRKKADYDDDLGEAPVNKAGKALRQANEILEGLAQLFPKKRLQLPNRKTSRPGG